MAQSGNGLHGQVSGRVEGCLVNWMTASLPGPLFDRITSLKAAASKRGSAATARLLASSIRDLLTISRVSIHVDLPLFVPLLAGARLHRTSTWEEFVASFEAEASA